MPPKKSGADKGDATMNKCDGGLLVLSSSVLNISVLKSYIHKNLSKN